MPQQQLLQQQRTARIDQIMKLFPEQNGNLLSSQQNQSQSSQQIQQQQQQTQQQQQLHHINYPLAMECDPTPASTSSNSSAPMSSRYNLLLSGIGANNTNNNSLSGTSTSGSGNHAHIHRSSRYPSMNVISTNHALIGSNAIASINNANNVLHHGSKSSTNLLSNYAPASLPIDLGQMMVSSGIGNNSSVDHSLSAYQQHHHLLTTSGMPNNAITGGIGGVVIGSVVSGGGGVGSTGGYIPYSMSSDAINVSMPTSNQVQIGSSNKNLSNPSSGSSSSVSGQSGTGAPRSSGTTANDRGDDSPMVGVCVQQSPVVIH